MNFLAHHAVARAVAPAGGAAAAAWYVGNLLPDLVARSGVGRLRAVHVRDSAAGDPLTQGIRLHLATDRTFHGGEAFHAAQEAAKAALRNAPFAALPPRLYFVAHVLVEIALDGLLVRNAPALADNLYAQFDRADLSRIAEEANHLLGNPADFPGIAETLAAFAEERYLYRYATGAGQAGALNAVLRRAGLPSLGDEDVAVLAAVCDSFVETLAPLVPGLLAPPSPPSDSGFQTGALW